MKLTVSTLAMSASLLFAIAEGSLCKPSTRTTRYHSPTSTHTMKTTSLTTPTPTPTTTATGLPACSVVGTVISLLEDYESYSCFCSTYLDILTSTTSTTFTSTISLTQTVPTITGTSTITPTVLTTTTVTTTETVQQCLAPSKRQVPVPISISSILSGIPTPSISAACSCLNLPTQTVTVTQTAYTSPVVTVVTPIQVTSTATPITSVITTTSTTIKTVCSPPPLCSNEGVQWGQVLSPFVNSDSSYSSFDPTYFKTQFYQTTGLTFYVDVDIEQGTSNPTLYGEQGPLGTNFAVNHRGYIFTTQTGLYTFSFDIVDDIALLWVGGYAYSGYDRTNAIAEFNTNTHNGSPVSGAIQVLLIEGEYVPYRIMFGQDVYNAYLEITLTAPDGEVLLDANSEASPAILQFSCDGVSAPPFPPFGAET